jgi:hypothetical protein
LDLFPADPEVASRRTNSWRPPIGGRADLGLGQHVRTARTP